MKVTTEKINGKIWHIAEFEKVECQFIGLEYPCYSVWEHDNDWDLLTTRGNTIHWQIESKDAFWFWKNSESDFDTYNEAIKWCRQFGK